MKRSIKYLIYSIPFILLCLYGIYIYVEGAICTYGPEKNTHQSTETFEPTPMSVSLVRVCTDDGFCANNAFLLSGQIYQGQGDATIKNIQDAVNRNPDIKEICLDSIGGDNESARDIAREISKLGLNTCLSSKFTQHDGAEYIHDEITCQSSCTWIMLAGKNRTAYSKVYIGFHGSSMLLSGGCGKRVSAFLAIFGWYKLAIELDVEHETELATVLDHLSLITWSFWQGYEATYQRGMDKLLTSDKYFTASKFSNFDSL